MVSSDPHGSNMPATPSRKDRRRSWFGLVTPKRKERASVMAPAVEPPSNLDGAMDRVEELEATPIRQSPDDNLVQRRRPWTVANDDDDDEEEDDYDDSDLEGTVRRKSKPQLVDDRGNGEGPVRMKDMATLAILSRNNTVKPVCTIRNLILQYADFTEETLPVLGLLSFGKRQLVVARRPQR